MVVDQYASYIVMVKVDDARVVTMMIVADAGGGCNSNDDDKKCV